MSDEFYKKIFSKNLKYYMSKKNKTQNDIVKDLGINKSTISTWVNGSRLPRMDMVNTLAEYFNINRSDLIEDKPKHNKQNNIELSNQEKALINKYRQLNEQQQYKVMGYIDSELHHNETAKESTPIYKIDNNTHSMVAENEYEYNGERYIKTDVAAYGATEDETMIADVEKFKKSNKEMQDFIDEENRKQKEYEEGVIKRVMNRYNISRDEAIKRIKNL